MTEFTQTLRHYCRNPRCRSKLPSPASDPRKAFCTRGCHSSFYLKRCLVCENDKPAGARSDRKFCRRPRCRTEYRNNRGVFELSGSSPWGDSAPSTLSSKSAQSTGTKSAHIDDRKPWRVVAGPELTASQLHCAVIPDGPDGWRGGGCERIEVNNCAALKTVDVFTEPEWREVMSPDGVRCFVTRFRDARVDGVPSDWKPCSPSVPVADDLSIPDFLKREPAAVSESADGILEAAE